MYMHCSCTGHTNQLWTWIWKCFSCWKMEKSIKGKLNREKKKKKKQFHDTLSCRLQCFSFDWQRHIERRNFYWRNKKLIYLQPKKTPGHKKCQKLRSNVVRYLVKKSFFFFKYRAWIWIKTLMQSGHPRTCCGWINCFSILLKQCRYFFDKQNKPIFSDKPKFSDYKFPLWVQFIRVVVIHHESWNLIGKF